jgi:hypothetical protein
MDSTLRSNLGVGMPLDVAVVRRDACDAELVYRIEPGDAYFHDPERALVGGVARRPYRHSRARPTSPSANTRSRLPSINAAREMRRALRTNSAERDLSNPQANRNYCRITCRDPRSAFAERSWRSNSSPHRRAVREPTARLGSHTLRRAGAAGIVVAVAIVCIVVAALTSAHAPTTSRSTRSGQLLTRAIVNHGEWSFAPVKMSSIRASVSAEDIEQSPALVQPRLAHGSAPQRPQPCAGAQLSERDCLRAARP